MHLIHAQRYSEIADLEWDVGSDGAYGRAPSSWYAAPWPSPVSSPRTSGPQMLSCPTIRSRRRGNWPPSAPINALDQVALLRSTSLRNCWFRSSELTRDAGLTYDAPGWTTRTARHRVRAPGRW